MSDALKMKNIDVTHIHVHIYVYVESVCKINAYIYIANIYVHSNRHMDRRATHHEESVRGS